MKMPAASWAIRLTVGPQGRENPKAPTGNNAFSREIPLLCPRLPRIFRTMRPVDIQQIGQELAIRWDDGTESFLTLEKLRRHCPCAGCKGEVDIMGNLYKGTNKPLSPAAFKLLRLDQVGGYALNPVWADAHSTGIFSFDYLKRLAAAE